MDKILKLYTYVDGGINDTPFPNSDNPIEIGAFRYDAKRMGGAPTITASVNYPSCLDDEWSDAVYAEFNGERYYLKQTPTSSYNNESENYKHSLELISERVILDNVYFFDTVVGDPQGDDKPVSNSTKVVFFGDVREFVARLNASLQYSHIDYTVVVDEEIETEEKLMSFEDQFFSNVLQEIYNIYEVPYYFEGKTIHVGWAKADVVIPTFSYGVDDALLSITKNNANFKVVNRVTGTGSSDNIPFYYPNNSPKGEIDAFTNREELKVKIIDHEVFCDKVEINKQITYRSASCTLDGVEFYHDDDAIINDYFNIGFYGGVSLSGRIKVGVSSIGHARVRIVTDIKNITNHKGESVAAISDVRYSFDGGKTYSPFGISEELFFDKEGDSFVNFNISIHVTDALGATLELLHHGDVKVNVTIEEVNTWDYDGKNYNLKDLGLDIASGIPQYGDTISQVITNYIKTAPHLMPSIYRETNGEERFYNAVNGIYDGLEFKNPYVEGRPKEHIITVEDVKPTIKDVKVLQPEGSTFAGFALNSDMFTEFAYDRNDNDETEDGEDENSRDFKHSYFFGKLRVLDFNLFDHAIENQPMTVSFTSGDCGACNFTIGVTEEFPQKNPVQVDDDGNLIYDEKTGNVVCGVDKDVPTFQERQQDTSKYEVWIALKKEEDTYGILMPKAPKIDESGEQMEAPYRPKSCTINEDGTPNNDGDTFVILGINLPKSYILNAEKKLEEEIIKYLKENNEEKFTFSIGFSRIYFEENPDVLQYLNENSRLNVTYNGKTYLLYITSYSYQMSEGDALPQITVELDENLTVSQNALQNAISEVKSEVGRALSNIDVLALSNPFFIRKDIDDVANGKINFVKGIKFGEGGKVEVMDNNSAKLTIEYLEVTKKASFTSLEIQEKTHVGGQILVTPASINCGEVEELDDVYRCYFQTKGTDGDEIFNQFAIGDQAICQTYNAWESKYYWRLVTGIGEDYIDLSKTECDEDSGIPSAGDKIIQLGNRTDVERQNAIVIAAYGDGSPYIIQYKGINSFEIGDDKVVTKLSSTENIFTGKIHMEMGSDGAENLNLEIGGQNLLRNSGFTGDFVTESLDGKSVLDENDEMFSDPLRHWITEGNVAVIDSEDSQSGKECRLLGSSLKQEMMYPIIEGENYALSFRARGRNLTYSVGGITKEIALTGKQARVIEKFTATSGGNMFAITNANATICEIQLERGNVVSAWGHSMWDNQSEIAKYQALNYLESAIKNGSTDILGGLIMSNIMLLGNPQAGDNTAGVSGIRNDENDVAFWGGGSYSQAIETVMKYVEDPNYQPTDAEVASMAKAVITHGGRAILNDIILRGIIYAKGGSFGDLKIGRYVNACGQADAEDSVFTERSHTSNDINYHTMVKLASGAIVAKGTHYDGEACYFGNTFAIDADTDEQKNQYGAVAYIEANNADAIRVRRGNIRHEAGYYLGLRPMTRVVTSDYTILPNEDCVVIADSTNNPLFVYVPTPSSLLNGAFIEVHNVGNATITLDTEGMGRIHYDGTNSTQRTLEPSKTARLVFSGERNIWYMTIV